MRFILGTCGLGKGSLRARWYYGTPGTFPSEDPFAGLAEEPSSLHPYQYGESNLIQVACVAERSQNHVQGRPPSYCPFPYPIVPGSTPTPPVQSVFRPRDPTATTVPFSDPSGYNGLPTDAERAMMQERSDVMMSTTIDFLWVFGDAKGWGEAITGRDLITGEEFPPWARWFALVCAKEFYSSGRFILRSSDDVAGLGHYGDEMVDAQPGRGPLYNSPQGSGGSGRFRGPAARGYDWDHILSHHSPEGDVARLRARDGVDNSIFEGLTEQQIKTRVKAAWQHRARKGSQQGPDGVTRVKYRGTDPESGQTLEMWHNEATGMVETAYPIR